MTDQLEASLEALVRRAQDMRAQQAPDPDRVRRALPVLAARRQRRRRAGLAGLAALAFLAMLTPAVLVANRTPKPPVAPPPPSPTSSALSEPAFTYQPAWLPPGFHESIRNAHLTAGQVTTSRTWTSWSFGVKRILPSTAPVEPFISVGVRPSGPDERLPEGTAVEVGGVPGTYLQRPEWGTSSLVWVAQGTDRISVDGSGVSRDDLLRVATSLHREPLGFPAPLRFGWLPGPPAALHYSLSGDSPIDWNATVTAVVDGQGTLTAMLAPATDAPAGGEAVPVGTTAGRLIEDRDPATGLSRQVVVVQPPPSRYILTLWFVPAAGSALDRDALLRLAARVDTDLHAVTDWIGG